MDWKIAEAKQRFSEVVRRAGREPQRILNRDRVVAAVVAADELDSFLAWRAERARGSPGAALKELVAICREEGLAYEAPARRDRENPLVPKDGGRRASRRHKRPE